MKMYLVTSMLTTILLLMTACSAADSESVPTTSQAPDAGSTGAAPASAPTPEDLSTDEFFAGVLDQLGIQRSEFALATFDVWGRMENTRAQWNPLATTMKATGSSDFNSTGVQNYPDPETGIKATTDTLELSYYDSIRTMLRQESFDRNDLETALNTWSGNGGYIPSLLNEWASLWPGQRHDVASNEIPKGVSPYEELLSFIPDTPQIRSGFIYINDYALVRQLFNVDLPTEATTDEIIDEYIVNTLAIKAGLAHGPWISGYHDYLNVFLESSQYYLDFDYRNIDQSVLVSFPPYTLEALRGRFDPKTITQRIGSCLECPTPIKEQHQNVPFFSWTEGTSGSIRMRVNPPIFDAQGRGGQLVVQDDYIFRTLESGAMKAMIDASEGQRQSLWDVEEFQIMANGLSELRPYSVFLSTDVASFQKQMRDTVRRVPQSRLDENPLLPYKAFSVGTGEDEVGRFIAIVLVHADSETAEQNAERLLRRIEENPRVQSGSVIKGSWRETVRDVYNLEIRAEEEALLAKLHLSGTLNSNGFHPNGSTWQHYVLGLAVADPLLLHE